MADCDASGPLLHGKRKFQLLSHREYKNSVEDLLGLEVGGLDQKLFVGFGSEDEFLNKKTPISSEAHAESYLLTAEAISEWAMKNGSPFSCFEAQTCANQFINETAYLGYRRPLTTKEASTFTDLFDLYGPSIGMKLSPTS